MSAHPTAVAAVSELGSLFPDKHVEVLTSQVEVAQLPVVVRRLRSLRDGGIVVLFTKVPEVVVLHQLRLSRMRDDGVTEEKTIPVDEGTLVVGMVKSRVPPEKPRPLRRARTEPRPASEPVRTELEVVEGADLRELDLRRFGRQLAGKKGRRKKGCSVAPVPRDELVRYGLARLVEGQVVPTLAGMLAYGHRPELWIEGACALVAVDGQERTFAGSIQKIVREALRWEPLVHCIGVELIAPALVNAFAHRDWSVGRRDQPVEVLREADRIEIRNPGGLAAGWSQGKVRPNPTLHRLLQLQGMAGRRGRGLDAVVRGLDQLGARPFSLVGRDGLVRFVMEMPWRRELPQVEVPREDLAAVQSDTLHEGAPTEAPVVQQSTAMPVPVVVCPMAAREATPAPIARPVVCGSERRPPARSAVEPDQEPPSTRRSPAERQVEVIELLGHRGELTTREIIEELGWTRSTTRAVLAALVDDGQVEGCAGAARSPCQRYRLTA